jgi:L-ribulose-5-phosphate 4-epimerase
MALAVQQLKKTAPELEQYVLEKHHQRKHGPNAYYGQK